MLTHSALAQHWNNIRSSPSICWAGMRDDERISTGISTRWSHLRVHIPGIHEEIPRGLQCVGSHATTGASSAKGLPREGHSVITISINTPTIGETPRVHLLHHWLYGTTTLMVFWMGASRLFSSIVLILQKQLPAAWFLHMWQYNMQFSSIIIEVAVTDILGISIMIMFKGI